MSRIRYILRFRKVGDTPCGEKIDSRASWSRIDVFEGSRGSFCGFRSGRFPGCVDLVVEIAEREVWGSGVF